MMTASTLATILRIVAVGMALFHMYTALFGLLDAILQRTIHLLLAFVILLLLHPKPFWFGVSFGLWGQRLYRLIIAVCAIAPLLYLLGNYEYLTDGRIQYVGDLTRTEVILGSVFILALLELTCRITGIALPAVCLGFIAFPFIPNMPGVFSHAGYTLAETLEFQYLTFSGVFGAPLAASANFIILFIIFGAFLERCGLGGFMMDFTTGILGHRRGGSAKVAVVGSALTGTISGSATANVLSTGALTIPLMKRAGYPPFMSGAIEAAASTGGALMPPVMGTVAFIMSEYSGVPYGLIALYAAIPAILYYLGIYCTVHFAAIRYNARPLDKSELPDWKAQVRVKWHLIIPIILLVILMGMDYSPQYSVGYSILCVIVVSWFRKETRLNLRAILEALENGAKGAILVAVATACAGIIVGVFDQTTVGVKLAQQGNAIAGTLFMGLIITMVISLIIGLGVPPTVSYLAQIAVTIPMLISFLTAQGVDPYTAKVSAHFFVMYYSTLAVITPPDALAAVAAAGIAGSPVMKTAVHASRVAFVAFVVPFMFVYRPSILMLGTWNQIIYDTFLATVGVVVVAAALEGFGRRNLNIFDRIWAFAAGMCLIVPDHRFEAVGLILAGTFLASNYVAEIKSLLGMRSAKPPA
jgi:TRAP transporter 4TM/12TM fusion protein